MYSGGAVLAGTLATDDLGWVDGAGPGGHGVVDGPDADRVGLVPAGGEQPGEAAALLRPPVPAGGGGRDLLRAARRADRAGLGGAGRQGPRVPQGRGPGGGGGGLGPVPGRARPAARRGQAGRDPAAVPALVPDRPGTPGV